MQRDWFLRKYVNLTNSPAAHFTTAVTFSIYGCLFCRTSQVLGLKP